MNNFLIYSSIEESWPSLDEFDNIILIGDWCKNYKSTNKISNNFKNKTLFYHWDDRIKLLQDYKKINIIYENALIDLSKKMNEIHNVNFDIYYWRILIGPWLGYFTQIVYDRWYMLKTAKSTYSSVLLCDYYSISNEDFVPNDFKDFNNKFIDPKWNSILYTYIAKQIFEKKSFIKKYRIILYNSNKSKIKYLSLDKILSIPKILIQKIYNFLFTFPTDAFLITTYLPNKINFLLQIKFLQFPKIWHSKKIPYVEFENSKRIWVLENKNNFNDFEFVEILYNLIPKQIPKIYLEGYEVLNQICNNLKWPTAPKFIFTSNSYSSDDVFKYYSAQKVNIKIPLIIGQHGGHLGTNLFAYYEEHQLKIATKYISWGWGNNKFKNIIPLGNFKNTNQKIKYNKKGKILILQNSSPVQSYHLYASPIASQFKYYLEDQFKFVKLLPKNIQEYLVIKLYPVDYGWKAKDRWNDLGLNLKIIDNNVDIKKLVKTTRIYISTYNATTYLESFTWNIPTIIFWDPNFWELNDEAHDFFNLLILNKIFHTSPESAAKHLINIWDNIDEWWFSDDVQNARKIFCNRFAKEIMNPVNDLYKVLSETIAQ